MCFDSDDVCSGLFLNEVLGLLFLVELRLLPWLFFLNNATVLSSALHAAAKCSFYHILDMINHVLGMKTEHIDSELSLLFNRRLSFDVRFSSMRFIEF